MSKEIEITYEISDRVLLGGRSKTVTVHPEDFEGMDRAEVRQVLYDYLWDEAMQIIEIDYEDSVVDEILEALKDSKESGGQ